MEQLAPSDSDRSELGTKPSSYQHQNVQTSYVVANGAGIEEPANTPKEGTIHGGIGGLSLDDIKAAQVLESIRTESRQSPKVLQDGNPTNIKIDPSFHTSSPPQDHQDVEPLFSLITSHHTLLSNAINVPLSAYTSTKSYSPSFRYGAELVERHIGSPVATRLSAAGRRSGVESGVRWLYNGSAPQRGSKRRRELKDKDSSSAKDVEKGMHPGSPAHTGSPNQTGSTAHIPGRRHSSVSVSDSLPPYDEHRSPRYEVYDSSGSPSSESASQRHPTWQARLITSTSGLGIAMSEESLRSLKYCLEWLRGANSFINRMTIALKDAIKELDKTSQDAPSEPRAAHRDRPDSQPKPRNQGAIAQHVRAIGNGVIEAFMNVVDVVSKYAGGALPANARSLVRSHLLSLPQRLNRASSLEDSGSLEQPGKAEYSEGTSTNSPNTGKPEAEETSRAARRYGVLANEGLDIMSQVSCIIDGTITSAEDWLDRLGRRKRGRRDSEDEQRQLSRLQDVKMKDSE
ncbi:MAG: hypothetical protein Q9218_002733 [Villophora microphyllina]